VSYVFTSLCLDYKESSITFVLCPHWAVEQSACFIHAALENESSLSNNNFKLVKFIYQLEQNKEQRYNALERLWLNTLHNPF
jgi:hypothetical protein